MQDGKNPGSTPGLFSGFYLGGLGLFVLEALGVSSLVNGALLMVFGLLVLAVQWMRGSRAP